MEDPAHRQTLRRAAVLRGEARIPRRSEGGDSRSSRRERDCTDAVRAHAAGAKRRATVLRVIVAIGRAGSDLGPARQSWKNLVHLQEGDQRYDPEKAHLHALYKE